MSNQVISTENETVEPAEWMKEMRGLREKQDADHQAGAAALARLFKVAQRDSGQCRHIAAFLLGCYNGSRFPFDLTDFRCIDHELFDDCMLVLRMDRWPRQEVHCYFEDGGRKFEDMAKFHGIKNARERYSNKG